MLANIKPGHSDSKQEEKAITVSIILLSVKDLGCCQLVLHPSPLHWSDGRHELQCLDDTRKVNIISGKRIEDRDYVYSSFIAIETLSIWWYFFLILRYTLIITL